MQRGAEKMDAEETGWLIAACAVIAVTLLLLWIL